MVSLPHFNNDPVFTKPSQYNKIDSFFLSLLRDERDLPFIYFTLKIVFLLIPMAVLLYLPALNGWQWIVAAVAYVLVNFIFFIGRFALMFHCTAHRVLFKNKFDFLNFFLPYFIAPFFGHMAHTYYSHHVGMHHAENNLEEDESTTMPFQRDSAVDFFLYLGNFILSGIYKVAAYFKKRNRKKLMYSLVTGEILYLLLAAVLCFINLQASIFVFVIPYFFYRFIAMFGNWAQHAFIDPAEPGNPYKNSITCINSKYNWQCWNDGYHISHHLKQNMHWTEHPGYFRQTIANYDTNNAVVFAKIDFMAVSFLLLCKRYDVLAENFVNIGNRFNSDEEVVLFLKTRVQRIKAA